jgi:tetratricopeptide (TPR) repeat protein
MKKAIKILYFVVISVGVLLSGWLFFREYDRFMKSGQNQTVDIEEKIGQKSTVTAAQRLPGTVGYKKVLVYGMIFVAFALVGGLTAGHYFSIYIGEKFFKFIYEGEESASVQDEYELGEKEWADGNHLKAIELMRSYLEKNPNEQHVAIRIAEIYERDLHNYLAAALEYEEILKHKLPPEQWGWTAIHLCNLYRSRLNQPEKAIELLKKIDTDYGYTAAAQKARKHLEGLTDDNEDESEGPDQQTKQIDQTQYKKKKKAGPASDQISEIEDD